MTTNPTLISKNAYGLYSLRAQVAYQEQQWLETTSGDENAPYPDDSYGGDDEERTLMNYYGEVKMGTDIYIFLEDGSYYQYYDDSGGGGGCIPECPVNVRLRNLKPGDPLPKGVKLINAPSSITPPGTCQRVMKAKDFINDLATGTTYRMKWKIKANDGPFGGDGHLKALTKSYKRINGKWKVENRT